MKNFLKWNSLKSKIDGQKNNEVYFYEREIWFTSCGLNVGFEEDGKGKQFARPVLIFRKFNKHVFWGIPLTKQCKEGKYYFIFQYLINLKSCALLSQLRLFDAKRLLKKDGTMGNEDYQSLRQGLKALI